MTPASIDFSTFREILYSRYIQGKFQYTTSARYFKEPVLHTLIKILFTLLVDI